MFVLDDVLVHSASDLAVAADCEFRLLTTLDAHLGRIDVATGSDPMFERLARLGAEHEQRTLQQFRRQFGDGVVAIARPSSIRIRSEIEASRDATLAAMAARKPVVYQGTVFSETRVSETQVTERGRSAFLGFSDFLVFDAATDSYTVYDTKLARHEQVSSILQIAAYADALTAAGVTMSPHAHLVLGDGTHSVVDLLDVLPVFRQARDSMVALLGARHDQLLPVSWDDAAVRACYRCDVCTPEIERTRDLLLVAGLRSSQRERLRSSAIETIDDLAEAIEPPPGMSRRIFDSLRAQASLQVRQETSGVPTVDFFEPSALGSLPRPDAGDIFFDFEGDPLWAESGSSDWGLEYLFGVTEADGTYLTFWAHDRAEEKQALVDFLDYVTERRRIHPQMHVYHYAAYEKSALLRLAGRHGIGEEAVDELLSRRILVDLYPIVRASVRVGARSYSIKKLEPLYMPAARGGDVQDAASSIVEYGNFCELRDQGQADAAEALLSDIADYNRYDCESTLALRDWLVGHAGEFGVEPHVSAPTPPDEDDRTDLELQLLARGDRALAMMAAALGYHRREDKPFWWGHFDRLSGPVDEWSDTKDTFVATAAETDGWQPPRTARSQPRRTVRLTGAWAEGSSIGGSVHLLYETTAPDWVESGDDPTTRWCSTGTVVAVSDDGTKVDVEETLKRVAREYDDLPMALTPTLTSRSSTLADAIERTARAALTSEDNAVMDLLRRIPPRTTKGSTLPRVPGDDRASVLAALLDSDNSYVAVQGPPGTGKTFTGSAVVADLVNRHGWRIGVVAQSHAVVENMLGAVVKAGVPTDRVAKRDNRTDDAPWADIKNVGEFLGGAGSLGGVVGGTAWAFVKDSEFTSPLDLLVIEEAGQFSLANTIAASRNARRLLLLGDPQQLPQVSQGRHPEPVDMSALEWLAGGHDTLPDDLGYFLATTWRMHPALCAPVSALAYDGRLTSCAPERSLVGVEPGVHTVLVAHEGNSTSSEEEAGRITMLIKSLLGKKWTDGGSTRRLSAGDVLVVAPYNAQVDTLRDTLASAGYADTVVGTVDKIQGREAPVVILSMTASAGDDLPRGMSFLLSRNRLNVAISRGQWAAFIVRSPRLTEYLPSTPAGLPELGAFLRLSPSR